MGDLQALERQLNKALRSGQSSYGSLGELFKAIRDDRLFEEAGFGSFRGYVQERWDMSVKTAYAYIQAAEVAHDVKDLKGVSLPQHHAQLLFRFDRTYRRKLAREIKSMSAREATRHVLTAWEELSGTRRKAKRRKREPASELAELMSGVRLINTTDVTVVNDALSALPSPDRRAAVKEITAARTALSTL